MKWDLHACDDLSGCWLTTHTLLGDLTIEHKDARTFTLYWWPLNLRCADNVTLGEFASIAAADAFAVKWWKGWKRKIARAA